MSVYALRPDFDVNNPETLILDLASPKPKDVLAIIAAFETDIKSNPVLGKLTIKSGWNTITPIVAADLLRRNRPGANRKIDPGTVFYYAAQMARDQWKATGQPILLDRDGNFRDGQHRMLAVIVSGSTIRSYVVTDIEPIDNLFAYIDNSRTRTPSTALQTAGFNGVAPIIVQVIKIGESVKRGVFDPTGAARLGRLSPIDVLQLSASYPNAQKAARSANSDWAEATEMVGDRKSVVAYFGMIVIDNHGESVADDFFEELSATDDLPADSPILALRKLAEKDRNAGKPMKAHHMLGALILVFNAWHRNETLTRRWMLQVNEDFPVLDTGVPKAQAAE